MNRYFTNSTRLLAANFVLVGIIFSAGISLNADAAELSNASPSGSWSLLCDASDSDSPPKTENVQAEKNSENEKPEPADKVKEAGKSKDADKSQAESQKAKEPNDDNWREYLDAAKNSYKSGKLAESAADLELALLGAERLREGAKGEAFLLIGEQYLYLKQYEKAKVLLEEAIRLRRSIPGFKSIASANALDTLAQAYARTGNLEEAKKSEAEALATYEALKKVDTPDYAIALANHANTLRAMKEYKEAESFFAKAVSAQQKLDKSDSIELAKILLNAGGMYCDMNKLDSAKRLLDRAFKIVRSNLKAEHPLYKLSVKSERVLYKKKTDSLLKADSNPYRQDVALAVGKLAELYEEEGDPSQALAAYKQAIDIREKVSPASPELARLKQRYSEIHNNLSAH